MNRLLLVYFFFWCDFAGHFAIAERPLCPKICNCYIWESLTRADCKGKLLISVDTGLGRQVKALDLSNNSINVIQNKELLNSNYINVRFLNLSFNQIKTIGLFAFKGMINLNILDLSHNYLRTISYKTFIHTKNLKKLDLSYNNLYINGPFLKIDSLEILELSHCQIDHLEENIFDGLPNLVEINLKNNQLIGLNVEIVKNLQNLKALFLNGNSISCDGNTKELQEWLDRKSIEDTTGCRKKVMVMERMMMAPSEESENYQKQERDLMILWNLTEETLNNEVALCPPINIETNNPDSIEGRMNKISSDIIIACIGFLIGVSVSVSVWCCHSFYLHSSISQNNQYSEVTNRNEFVLVERQTPSGTPPPRYRDVVKSY